MKEENIFTVYIMANYTNSVLYTGMTGNLHKRIFEHKEKLADGFTKKYNCNKLVYYEICDDVDQAVAREHQIKAGSRKKKVDLIESMNSKWRDMYEDLSE